MRITGAAVLLVMLAFPAFSETYQKVLIIGDSITSHGPAVEKLGWSGNWGMAASSEDKDYAHLFLAKLAASQGGQMPKSMIGGGGGGKLPEKVTVKQSFTDFAPDLAVIQMGENDNTNVTEEGFQKPYEEILEAIRAGNSNAKILCFGVWSPPSGSALKDKMIRAACAKYNAIFVDLKDANANPVNRAGSENRFTHPGVNWHPGDKGMQAYADALWTAFTTGTPVTEVSTTGETRPDWSVKEDWSGGGEIAWSSEVPLVTEHARKVAEITQKEPDGTVSYVFKLPVEQCKGHIFTVRTKIKADNVSEKPNPWNGIKVMLRLKNAEGELDYPQFNLPVGSFDWTEVDWSFQIPDNIVDAQFILGLEKVTGTIRVDAMEFISQAP